MVSTQTKQPAREGPAERLLKAADELFYRQGYAATGINELMQTAGVAKASFYHHFSSKDALVVAYLRQRATSWFAQLTQSVDRRTDPTARVIAVFDFLEEWLVGCDYRGCAFLKTIPEFPDPASEARQEVRKAKQGLHEYIARQCTEAGLPDAGDELFLLFEGATAQAMALCDRSPIQAAQLAVRRPLEQAG